MKISQAAKAAVATMAVTAATLGVAQNAAHAAGDTPLYGELCQAAENIQFWNDAGVTSYTVQTNEYIRIDSVPSAYYATGHGDGHSTRNFQWKHSNGQSRVKNCH
ncbi:MAG: hypothetical protein NTV28_12770 [Propionibacteriales bacterium]|nr:hypothetical protein [Propionibacteriales bacterium]